MILQVHFSITITIPANTLPLMGTGINLCKMYTVLQITVVPLLPVTKREVTVQNLIYHLILKILYN